MKRQPRKIILHRETLRNLETDQLGAGAAVPLPVSWNCTITQTGPCQGHTRYPICLKL